MSRYEKQKGITLIALIITIVVLLILAAVTISLTIGERGIFNTAQQAGKNYKEASDKELADLTNLEKEMQNVIKGIGNGGAIKPNPQPVKLNTLDAIHYGDYVDYKLSDGTNIGRGPDESVHKTDWRIFYNNGTYVYLIASYLLENSQAPTGIGMSGVEGRPYSTYWEIEPTTYTPIRDDVRANYKMS